jgi:acyl-CoA synthetase (AMP-forming)/AMP-acid ligase II
LARPHWPRRWVVRDSLPLTPSGKVNRRALAASLSVSAA